jgi:hypothetical protein
MGFVRKLIANELTAPRRSNDTEFDCVFAQKIGVILRPNDVFSNEQLDVLNDVSI